MISVTIEVGRRAIEDRGKEITRLPFRHRFELFSVLTLNRKAGVFILFRFEERFLKAPFL